MTLRHLLPTLVVAALLAPRAGRGAERATAASATNPAHVASYAVRLEPAFTTRSVWGVEQLRVRIAPGEPSVLELACGRLVIDAVRAPGSARVTTSPAGLVRVAWPVASGADTLREVRVAYHGTPASGLVFRPEARQVHTAFATEQWMPCVPAPAERATFELALVLPRGMVVAASGEPRGQRALPRARVESRWVLERALPAYLFGFAAGPFIEDTAHAGGTRLRALAAPGFSGAELQRVFRDTGDMLRFFEARAGRPFPAASYTQILLAGSAAQELGGMAVLGERYGRRVLADSSDVWLGAHELAHQWWGNGVTNARWNHFWLNEGFASFMAAAYLEQRFGRAAYDTAIAASRANVDDLRARGKDCSLVFADWSAPTDDDRSLVYDKGTVVLAELRQELGEAAFWNAIRDWTNAYWGRAVETADFQRAVERSSGRDLHTFFARWVYATEK